MYLTCLLVWVVDTCFGLVWWFVSVLLLLVMFVALIVLLELAFSLDFVDLVVCGVTYVWCLVLCCVGCPLRFCLVRIVIVV